jgi:hypothetical protein
VWFFLLLERLDFDDTGLLSSNGKVQSCSKGSARLRVAPITIILRYSQRRAAARECRRRGGDEVCLRRIGPCRARWKIPPFRLEERLANVRAFSFIKRREVVCANCVCRVGFHVVSTSRTFGLVERDA